MRLRERRAEIAAAGGVLAAISVDRPETSQALARRLAADGGPLGFPLLSDPTRATIKAYGLHDAAHDIALPAVLVLGPDGRIAWKHAGEGVTDRPPEDDVIAALSRTTR